MTEVNRIGLLLKHGYDGEPWYGTALSKLLANVTAAQAAAHPIAGAHSIWQEVLHLIKDRRVSCRLLQGETVARSRRRRIGPSQRRMIQRPGNKRSLSSRARKPRCWPPWIA
jgi:hypothetical protein